MINVLDYARYIFLDEMLFGTVVIVKTDSGLSVFIR